MRIAYIDLNAEDHFEDYSYNPKKYGGGNSVGKVFLEKSDDFHIYSNPQSFLHVRADKASQCFSLNERQRLDIRNGISLSNFLDESKYDLVFHHFTDVKINTDLPTLVWGIGLGDRVHEENSNLALFSPLHQYPLVKRQDHNLFRFILGINIPKFEIYKKQDYIFQCHRQCDEFRSHGIAYFAKKYKIPCIFAGPVNDDYKDTFFKNLDGDLVKYIGVIDEETKIQYLKNSCCYFQLQRFPIPVTLGAKQALSYGTPIIATKFGEWTNFIEGRINGFFIEGEDDMLKAYNRCKNGDVSQSNCYSTILQYSEENMTNSLNNIFLEVLNKVK